MLFEFHISFIYNSNECEIVENEKGESMNMLKKYQFLALVMSCTLFAKEMVTIAILAKDKAHTLPEYLHCIEHQTWPKSNTYLYVRTNNNTDETACMLRDWLAKVRNQYADVYFDDSDVDEPVQNYKQHEWNTMRFRVLGSIRQESVDWAKKKGSHYFVVDCDNFIKSHVIETMMETGLPIVAPFLKKSPDSYYSNYHFQVDENGYFLGSPLYYKIFAQEVKGLLQVAVVHCTYLIRHEVLHTVCYDDHSCRYEYVIFSDNARKQQVPQYLDNRQLYGRITMAEDRQSFISEPWFSELSTY